MNKKREYEEIITIPDTGTVYRFAGNFAFVRALHLAGRNISLIFADLADDLLIPDEIKNVIKFSMEEINGEPVADGDLENAAVEFVELSGLQDASFVARMMIAHAVIGKVKKKQIRESEAIKDLIFQSKRSHWSVLLKIGLLWVGLLAISTVAAIMIIKLCWPLIIKSMG